MTNRRPYRHTVLYESRDTKARRLLREAVEALACAFSWADTDRLYEEIHGGRWNGIRAIVEEAEEVFR